MKNLFDQVEEQIISYASVQNSGFFANSGFFFGEKKNKKIHQKKKKCLKS